MRKLWIYFLLAWQPVLADQNAVVLNIVNQMKNLGGTYALTSAANQDLKRAISIKNNKLTIKPNEVSTSYCTTATYLVFLKAIADTHSNLDENTLQALLVKGQPDGQGVWGRWNANGPGTARLFYELKIGKNYTKWSQAKPGDFMKIFWNDEIGKSERGHSVVYLGTVNNGTNTRVKFWGSNQGMGMAVKTVDKNTIKRVVFSRLENSENIVGAASLPKRDSYLGSLTSVASTPAQMYQKIGLSQGGAK